ncbi:uncharacterized protein LOC135390034 [Ornithodoros turicata]|uniref:uncharacterized protein LOC135390034 n=1 Tax=Ornithodoros turicata TaxID=34597 RepID=UPI003139D996
MRSFRRWHQERRCRITSSNAHRVWTRTVNEEGLVQALLNSRRFSNAATKYESSTEAEARLSFASRHHAPVYETGVMISICQPWLCGSPDGIIWKGGEPLLLEIKCPFSRAGKELYWEETQSTSVPYLEFRDAKLCLKQRHTYYTQVQLLMYIAGVQKAHFYVYTTKQQADILVQRDEQFLCEVVPKLEKFYFEHYLQRLT